MLHWLNIISKCYIVSLRYYFNRDAKPRIIVGHEDGMVRTYDIPDNDKFQQNPDVSKLSLYRQQRIHF